MQKSLVPAISFLIGCLLISGVGSVRAGKVTPPLQVPVTVGFQVKDELKGIATASFGATKSGEKVTEITCTNRNGNRMRLINYGAAVVSLELPDRDGKRENVVLTCPDIAGFEACGSYFNAIAGRYCNRIARGRFSIGEREYQLAVNNGEHHLHGGVRGFDKRIWQFEPFSSDLGVGVKFSYTSPDGEEGYPGNLSVTASYTLTHDDQWIVEIKAETDATTPVNLTNHNYWNLAGGGTILGHQLRLNSSAYLPVDAGGIPEAEIADVTGTAFDFREGKAIGKDFSQLAGDPGGYDHCFVVDGEHGTMRPAARLFSPESGRWMEIETTEPGIQFYTGNFLDGSANSGGYAKNSALCLETEFYPNSPNRPDFPSCWLKPGEAYFHKTIHRFGVEK